eukprot:837245-Rhodomonas_salina.1
MMPSRKARKRGGGSEGGMREERRRSRSGGRVMQSNDVRNTAGTVKGHPGKCPDRCVFRGKQWSCAVMYGETRARAMKSRRETRFQCGKNTFIDKVLRVHSRHVQG